MKNEKIKTNAMAMAICMVIIVVSAFTAVIAMPGVASGPSNAEPVEEIEIDELQQRVYDQGYSYTVAENWVTQLSPEDREALCGYKHLKALGYVTPVKNQGPCGSCYIFGATADFESDVAIGESTLFDFSEQEVGGCNIWSRVGGYDFCNGGNALMTTNYFTKNGSADETCHPYAATPETCYGCPLLKNVDNWRMVTGGNGESQINTIKNAILNYGPVYSTIYASDPGFLAYTGGVYDYGGSEPTDHAIEIIGWNDSKGENGAWMIKNSWGTGWGASGPYPGCAWVAYEAANLGDDTSAIAGYKKPGDVIFYHDECGWMLYGWGYYGATTAYGAVRFVPEQDTPLTAVDFWAVVPNMNYEIKVFDTLNTLPGYYTFSNQLGTPQIGTTDEKGYYSIPLNTPIPLTRGNDFIVQVKLTTTGYEFPIPIDYCTASWLPPWSTIAKSSEESYGSKHGTEFTKVSITGVGNIDVGIRARAGGQAPEPTISIETDKFKYCPRNTMNITIDISNPTKSPVTFKWYLGVPTFGYWGQIYSVTLPAGFEYTFEVPLYIGAWSEIPFSAVWYVDLQEPETGQELAADCACWSYCPTCGETTAMTTSMPLLKDIATEIGEEIEGIV
jgi:C1A family cysteine protease